jgi:hypothetical protein
MKILQASIVVSMFTVAICFGQASHASIPVNEYRCRDGALVCFSDTTDDLACLHVGWIKIGGSYSLVEKKYSTPSQELHLRTGDTVEVFQFTNPDSNVTYLAITVKSGMVSAIEIQGEHAVDSLSFSSINLGDLPGHLIEILGKPSKSLPVQETGGTLWSYVPFPFSFEITNGKVSSIKIWRP